MRMLATATVAGLVLAACGAGDDAEPPADTAAPVDDLVVATTSIWADIATNVRCGRDVPTVVPVGADPHTFEPSLRDRELLEDARTVVANGNGLEGSLVDLLETVAAEGVNVVEMATHVDVLVTDEEHDDDHTSEEHDDEEHDDGHGHADAEDGDPHIWHDPRRVAGTLDVLGGALADQGDAEAVRACADEYRAELEQLDAEIEALLAPIPESRRVLVTSHDSLAYFADRYGFEIVGTVIPSTTTMAETSAALLAELAATIDEQDVPAIFTDRFEADADAEALADRLGIAIVPLHGGSLTEDGPASTYVGMMRENAGAIAAALATP